MGKKKRKDKTAESSDDEAFKSKKAKFDDSTEEVKTEDTAESEDEDTKEQEKMKLLVASFSNQQQDQYEVFRRAAFPRSRIKTLMQSVCGTSIPQNAVIAMAGMAKVYVGEIVELACASRDRQQDEGPLKPKHIREASRILRQRQELPSTRHRKTLF